MVYPLVAVGREPGEKAMLEGLMQHDVQLTVQMLLRRMRSVGAAGEVATLQSDGSLQRCSYAELGDRVDRLCTALASLGVGRGDRVATLAWNTQAHLEAYLAAPSMGAVLHTLNLRLPQDQLTYIVDHAEDAVVIVDETLVPLLAAIAPRLASTPRVVIVGDGDDGGLPGALRYEELLADSVAAFDYPEIDERHASGLCYTSGTTGNPKGVLYSHRSTVLHAMAACMNDTLGVSARDRILPVVPMFHANAWGIPYAAALAGADLVMPGRFLQAERIAQLIEDERVTIAGAVPTIWMDLLRYADEHRPDLSSLRIVPCGGAAVPRGLMEAFEERHGVPIVQAWGMTETSPLGSVAHEPRDARGEERWRYKAMAGRVCAGVEPRLVDDDGREVPWDGESTGELEVRGPWVASAYYRDPSPEKFDDGWLRTGDVAAIEPGGYIRLTDRAKDVIKSGGEWISSVELENELMAHPAVAEAAVIARPDERWTERPLACVVPEADAQVTADELAAHLADRVARWWIPEEFAFIDEVPKTSVGKFDKKVLRARLSAGELGDRHTVDRSALPGESLARSGPSTP
jgi:fatty-acyl-CoA synthase